MAENASTHNATQVFFGPPMRPFKHKIAFTFGYTVIFLTSIIGNSLIIWIVRTDRRLKNTTNYLVANMATSDLVSTFFMYFLQVSHINFSNRWLISGDFGNALCKLTPFVGDVSLTVSFYSCLFIAFDRYFAVVNPLARPLERKIKHILTGIWCFSLVLNSPHLYFFETITGKDGVIICAHSFELFSAFQLYRNVCLALTAGFPVLVVTLVYVIIVYKLFSYKAPGESADRTLQQRQNQNKNVLKMSVAIIIALYLSYGVHFIISMLFSHGKLSHLSQSTLDALMPSVFFMLNASVVYNFFIYVIFNKVYRENVTMMLAKCCCKTRNKKTKRRRNAEMNSHSNPVQDTISTDEIQLKSVRVFVVAENEI